VIQKNLFQMSTTTAALRRCLREPIPEIAEAARNLDEAVSAHLGGQSKTADILIRRADMPVIREWTESIWGRKSRYAQYRVIAEAPPKVEGKEERMPTLAEKAELLERDGYHCRFCGIPVIRREIRERIRKAYPRALPWGRTNLTQHAAFQAMWVQYDHVIPYTRGGLTKLNNLIITCAPCNFGRMEHTLEEVGLIDPRKSDVISSSWDGLKRFR
jgi:5-methylcytosine-specific restriction endonuclease McrA